MKRVLLFIIILFGNALIYSQEVHLSLIKGYSTEYFLSTLFKSHRTVLISYGCDRTYPMTVYIVPDKNIQNPFGQNNKVIDCPELGSRQKDLLAYLPMIDVVEAYPSPDEHWLIFSRYRSIEAVGIGEGKQSVTIHQNYYDDSEALLLYSLKTKRYYEVLFKPFKKNQKGNNPLEEGRFLGWKNSHILIFGFAVENKIIVQERYVDINEEKLDRAMSSSEHKRIEKAIGKKWSDEKPFPITVKIKVLRQYSISFSGIPLLYELSPNKRVLAVVTIEHAPEVPESRQHSQKIEQGGKKKEQPVEVDFSGTKIKYTPERIKCLEGDYGKRCSQVLWLMDLESGQRVQLSPSLQEEEQVDRTSLLVDYGIVRLKWSLDGRKLAFGTRKFDFPSNMNDGQIFVVDFSPFLDSQRKTLNLQNISKKFYWDYNRFFLHDGYLMGWGRENNTLYFSRKVIFATFLNLSGAEGEPWITFIYRAEISSLLKEK